MKKLFLLIILCSAFILWGSSALAVLAVPLLAQSISEPVMMFLLGSGLVVLGGIGRKRLKK
jgi:hypothetical protein